MTHEFQNDIDTVQRIGAVPAILDVVCRSTGMGYAAVVRVTEGRWVACQVLDNIDFGLPAGGELPIESTLCNEVRQSREVIVIDHVAADPIYADHHTPALYGLQSYISMPILLPDGRFFGTLCAIDPKPAALNNPQTLGTFRLFAELIAYHLEADEKLNRANASLLDAEATAQLREQFIAVLGHDLRNPLASLDGGLSLLARQPQNDRSTNVIGMMRSSILRMSGLIDNVMDFARGRLGGGLGLQRVADRPLGPTLIQVVAEIRSAHPERRIEVDIDLTTPIEVDHDRLSQMFSNLLGNAITHGSADQPIRVHGLLASGYLHVSVANAGTAIAADAIDNLFQPFRRGGSSTHAQGLGLGLYIASQIAIAHGGRIDVTSDAAQTVFTFLMPADTPAD